jgi:nitrite reductase (NO-forming)
MKLNRRAFLGSIPLASVALAHDHVMTPAPHRAVAATDIGFHSFNPVLPPLSPDTTTCIHMAAREVPVCIKPGLVVSGWTFDGDIPGPVIHVRQGDTIDFTLTNEGMMPHSMDFHCALVDPKKAFRSVGPGQSVSFSFTARYPGAFLYHCGTPPILMHLGSGMFGAIIVDPAPQLAPAKEFVLVQSEFYLNEPKNGVAASSYTKMLTNAPDIVAFNGRPGQYHQAPLRVKRGDRVRFYVVTAGPTHPCFFHVVGQQFETVYLGAPPANAAHGIQTFSVPPGGGMIFEFTADIAGEFPFVNHGFGHGQKGATGLLLVEE